jgi:flagellar biosynthesis protein FlhB
LKVETIKEEEQPLEYAGGILVLGACLSMSLTTCGGSATVSNMNHTKNVKQFFMELQTIKITRLTLSASGQINHLKGTIKIVYIHAVLCYYLKHECTSKVIRYDC